MNFEFTLIFCILSIIIDNYIISFNINLTSFLIFINIIAIYIIINKVNNFLNKIEFEFKIRYSQIDD